MVSFQPDLSSKLNRMYEELEEVKKPLLDEQQLEQLNEIIYKSMEFNQTAAVTYYTKRQYKLIIGHFHYYNEMKRTLKIVDKFGEWIEIKLTEIVDITIN